MFFLGVGAQNFCAALSQRKFWGALRAAPKKIWGAPRTALKFSVVFLWHPEEIPMIASPDHRHAVKVVIIYIVRKVNFELKCGYSSCVEMTFEMKVSYRFAPYGAGQNLFGTPLGRKLTFLWAQNAMFGARPLEHRRAVCLFHPPSFGTAGRNSRSSVFPDCASVSTLGSLTFNFSLTLHPHFFVFLGLFCFLNW